MANSQSSMPVVIDQRSGHSAKRSRTGCAGCRRRKIKCDERQPICGQCEKFNRECDSSSRLFRLHDSSFAVQKHPSSTRYSSNTSQRAQTASPSSGAETVWVNVPRQVVFVNEAAHNNEHLDGERWSEKSPLNSPSNQDLTSSPHSIATQTPVNHEIWSPRWQSALNNITTPISSVIARSDVNTATNSALLSSTIDHSATVPVTEPQKSDPRHLLERRSDYSQRRETNQEVDNLSEIQHDIESSHEVSFFLRHFSETVAMWMDLFDLEYFFSRQVPILAIHNPLVRYAACAFAAKQLGRVRGARSPRGGVATRLSSMETWPEPGDIDYIWFGAKYYDKAISLLMDKISNVNQGQDASMQTAVTPIGTDSVDSDSPQSPRISRSSVRLRDKYSKRFNDETMVAATILCNYEFLSATTQGWSGHLDGTRSLLQLTDDEGVFQFQDSPRLNALPPKPIKIMKATFWNFARQDFLASLIHRKTTRLDPNNLDIWRAMGLSLDDDGLVVSSILPEQSYSTNLLPMKEDMISNALVWLLSKIVNFIALSSETKDNETTDETSVSESPINASTWSRLNIEVNRWFEGLPSTFKPCARIPTDLNRIPGSTHTSSNITTESWFSNSMCASTMQSYHMARILLLIHCPVELLANGKDQRRDLLTAFHNLNNELRHHAIEICSISLSRPDDATRIHSLQPLYMAGRCLVDERDREIVVDLIRNLENDLGWATKYRVDQLIKEWNTEKNGFQRVNGQDSV